jgi:hypothetical protein
MKKNISQPKKSTQIPKAPSSKKSENTGFYEKVNQWIKKREWYFVGAGLFFTALFGILLFDPFINEMGDDTAYIERAYQFLHHGVFPSFQAPLYPMFLSLFVWISGINIIVLKGVSLIFLMLSILFLFLAFRKHIDPAVNIFMVFMTAFSGHLLFFGSSTFSETFYMGIQSLAVFVFVKYYVSNPPITVRQQIVSALWMGFLVFLTSITRTIGVIMLPAIVIILLSFKQWKDAAFNVISFMFYYIVFAIIKKLFFGVPFVGKNGGQASMLMQKNPYNPADGMEDLAGYITRLFENANLYISQYFYRFFHLRETASQPLIWLTVITVIILLATLWKAYQNKDKITTFLALYSAFFMGASFIILQTFWKQDRLLFPVFPLVLFLLIYAFVKYLDWKKKPIFAIIGLIFMASLIFISFGDIAKKSQDRKAQKAYFKGDRVYTYSADWKNYLLMSQWAADNMPDDAMIAARKSSMSNIFSGKFKFHAIYQVPIIRYENSPEIPENYLAVIMSPQLVNTHSSEFTQNLVAVIHTTESIALEASQPMNIFGLYHIPESAKPNLERLRTIGFPFVEPADIWIRQHALKEGVSFYSPEELYQSLKTNNVNYALMASLRLNPNDASAGIISTVNRYIYYISLKYPNFFGEAVHTIGATDPASLHLLNYN